MYAAGFFGLQSSKESIRECLSEIGKRANDILPHDSASHQLQFFPLQGYWSYCYLSPLIGENNQLLGYTVLLNQNKLDLSSEQLNLLDLCNNIISCKLQDMASVALLQQQLRDIESTKRMLAHDIRSPLNGIKGLIQLAADDLGKKKIDDLPLYLKMIDESSTSLLTMTEDLLNFTVFSDSYPKTGEDHYTLKSFCTLLQRLFKPRLVRKLIDFDFKVTTEMSNVPFFKDHTFQIASNLLSNAIKFTPEGGHVWVRLDMKIELGHKKLCINITDSGVGMDEKAIESILTGSGAHTIGTTGEKGFGFGLVAVRDLIESGKGTMKINSVVGKGTTFDVTLPLV